MTATGPNTALDKVVDTDTGVSDATSDDVSLLEWLHTIADRQAPDPGAGPVRIPVAWIGRTSTEDQQDPTLSLPRQLATSRRALPEEMVIVAHFYDVESDRKSAEQRGHGQAHEHLDIPIPRDGGLTDALIEARRPDRGVRGRVNPPSQWIWSSRPTHEPLVTKDLFEAASAIGRFRRGSRPGATANRHPATKRTYLLRSYLFCGICGRRLWGNEEKGAGFAFADLRATLVHHRAHT